MKNSKNGIIKKIIPTVMAGVAVVVTAFSMTGCSYRAKGVTKFVFVDNEYIIYNGVLHKGDVMSEEAFWGDTTAPTPKIKCDCGLERGTSMYVSSKEKPHEDEYDSICDVCF